MTKTKSTYLAFMALLLSPMAANAGVIPVVLPDSSPVTVNVEDDSGLLDDANWFIFAATAGASIDLDINRLVADPDLCAELYFGDVTGLTFGSSDADCFGQNAGSLLTFLFAADDTENDPFGGPFGDPRFTFSAPTTGIYSLVVTTLNLDGVGDPFEVIATGVDNISVPEPGTLALLGLGLVGIAARRRKTV